MEEVERRHGAKADGEMGDVAPRERGRVRGDERGEGDGVRVPGECRNSAVTMKRQRTDAPRPALARSCKMQDQ
jgi:hypothetical protein